MGGVGEGRGRRIKEDGEVERTRGMGQGQKAG